jgi:hypothetical protein
MQMSAHTHSSQTYIHAGAWTALDINGQTWDSRRGTRRRTQRRSEQRSWLTYGMCLKLMFMCAWICAICVYMHVYVWKKSCSCMHAGAQSSCMCIHARVCVYMRDVYIHARMVLNVLIQSSLAIAEKNSLLLETTLFHTCLTELAAFGNHYASNLLKRTRCFWKPLCFKLVQQNSPNVLQTCGTKLAAFRNHCASNLFNRTRCF